MDDFAGSPPEQREDRGPRIPPAKLESINAEPTISIFYKAEKNAVTNLLDGKFPRDAAMIFCDRIRHELMDNSGCKSFTIVGGDLDGHKAVLAWIRQCVSERSIVKFKDLDESTPSFFTAYVNIILSSYYFGIPPRDLSDHLIKRMTAIARKQLMTMTEVEWFYKTPLKGMPEEKQLALREVAATSVFWAWWNGKLDSNDTPEEMMTLSVLRQENIKLDHDLHDWCERNEREVRRKWEEKDRAKKYGGQTNENETGDGFPNTDGGGGLGSGWDQTPTTSAGVVGDWEQSPEADGNNNGNAWDASSAVAASANLNNWDNTDIASEDPRAPPNSLASPDFHANGNGEIVRVKSTRLSPLHEITNGHNNGFDADGGDWAEEVNEQIGQHQANQFRDDQW